MAGLWIRGFIVGLGFIGKAVVMTVIVVFVATALLHKPLSYHVIATLPLIDWCVSVVKLMPKGSLPPSWAARIVYVVLPIGLGWGLVVTDIAPIGIFVIGAIISSTFVGYNMQVTFLKRMFPG